MFDHIPGNETVKGYLKTMLQKKAYGQALLFAGPDSADKEAFAAAFAREITGGREIDIRNLNVEGKVGLYSIDTIRRLREDAHLPPFEAEKRIFILKSAHQMQPAAANALLKTLEEPAATSLFILLTYTPHRLMPTILSRMRVIRFEGTDQKKQLDEKSPLYHLLYQPLNAADIIETVDELIKSIEADMPLQELPEQQLTALQKKDLEKENDGIQATFIRSKLENILETALSWYRDLEAIHVKGAPLLNDAHIEQLHHLYNSGQKKCLNELQKKASKAILSFERSLPLTSVLEDFFLSV